MLTQPKREPQELLFTGWISPWSEEAQPLIPRSNYFSVLSRLSSTQMRLMEPAPCSVPECKSWASQVYPLSKNYSEWRGGSISRELWSQNQKEPWGARMTLSICHLLIWNKWLHGSVESFWIPVEWSSLCLMDQPPIPMMVFLDPGFWTYAPPNAVAFIRSPPLLGKKWFGETGQ